MFIAVYEFVVRAGQEEAFIRAWAKRTEGIYRLSGSLGSRLHRNENGNFIGYAQWPSREVWCQIGTSPLNNGHYPEYDLASQQMQACLAIPSKTLFEMDVEEDYLRPTQFQSQR